MPEHTPAVFRDPMSEADAVDLAAAFAALANPNRLQMLAMIRANPGTYVEAMMDRLPIASPTAYHHARALVESGLVDGRWVRRKPTRTVELTVAADALAEVADQLRAVVCR